MREMVKKAVERVIDAEEQRMREIDAENVMHTEAQENESDKSWKTR